MKRRRASGLFQAECASFEAADTEVFYFILPSNLAGAGSAQGRRLDQVWPLSIPGSCRGSGPASRGESLAIQSRRFRAPAPSAGAALQCLPPEFSRSDVLG